VEMKDQELIRLYLNGDIGALNILVKRYHKPVFNYILKLVGNREAADDLAQTVFIKCYKSLRRLKDHNRFAPWLYRIAVNVVRDYWRQRRDMAPLDDESDDVNSLTNLLASDDDPYEAVEAEQRAELVRRALKMLPQEQREVLVLKIYQGLKFTEIAEIVDAPLNTVKSRLYYGISALKKIFQRWNIPELKHYEV